MSRDDSKLLIDEHPLQVLPTLAVKIGLNEAIVLQQVHYWIGISRKSKDERKFRDGRWWVYNTYQDWQENFPWWSSETIRRTIYKLERMGLLISCQIEAPDWDHTKWYSINYDMLNDQIDLVKLTRSIKSKCPDRSGQDDTILIESETTTETSTKTTTDISANPAAGRTAEQRKQETLEALAHGINRDLHIKESFEKAFNLTPDWETRTARSFTAWAKRLPPGQTFEDFAFWWKRSDWRGSRGQPVTMALVRELWPQAFGEAETPEASAAARYRYAEWEKE